MEEVSGVDSCRWILGVDSLAECREDAGKDSVWIFGRFWVALWKESAEVPGWILYVFNSPGLVPRALDLVIIHCPMSLFLVLPCSWFFPVH